MFSIRSGYPPEFTPYLTWGGYDEQTEFINRHYLKLLWNVLDIRKHRKQNDSMPRLAGLDVPGVLQHFMGRGMAVDKDRTLRGENGDPKTR